MTTGIKIRIAGWITILALGLGAFFLFDGCGEDASAQEWKEKYFVAADSLDFLKAKLDYQMVLIDSLGNEAINLIEDNILLNRELAIADSICQAETQKMITMISGAVDSAIVKHNGSLIHYLDRLLELKQLK